MRGQSTKAEKLYGRIRGVVTDSTGAVVSNAEVKITNKGTGATREATTDQNGAYEFVSLPVGIYSVNTSKTGFRSVVVDSLNLTQDQVYIHNVTLVTKT